MSIRAYRLSNGRYELYSTDKNGLYRRRQAIKAVGGTWDGAHWTVPPSALITLGAERMFEVVTSCQNDRTREYRTTQIVPESLATIGRSFSSTSCGCCYAESYDRVEEIIGEFITK